MNHWLANSIKNLLPLSRSPEFREALGEWFFTGEVDDYEGEHADILCELCEHPDLVHHFHIKNALTEQSLLVGSSCILKFEQIEVRDNRGRPILDPILRKGALNSALRARIVETSLAPLRKLWRADRTRRHEIEFLAAEIKEDLGLSPKQLGDLFQYFEEYQVHYSPKLYKVKMRSYEFAHQVGPMSPSEFNRIAPALSSAQLKRARKWRREE